MKEQQELELKEFGLFSEEMKRIGIDPAHLNWGDKLMWDMVNSNEDEFLREKFDMYKINAEKSSDPSRLLLVELLDEKFKEVGFKKRAVA